MALGLDLSLTSTGIALVRDGRLAEVGNVKTKGKVGDSLAVRADRLRGVLSHIELGFVRSLDLDIVVIESPSYGSSFGSAHDRSGLWWLVSDLCHRSDIPVATVSPPGRAKYITGSGKTKDKEVVLAHAIERYVVDGGPRIVNDDVADAVGLADMGARWLGEPVVPDELMPAVNLEAMGGAAWPE